MALSSGINLQRCFAMMFFKDQINVINNNREDDVKKEDGEMIDNMHKRYIQARYVKDRYKLKNESDKYCIYFISTIKYQKTLQQFNQVIVHWGQ